MTPPDLFAVDDASADAAYTNIRAPQGEGAAVARANCNELWRDFASYASEHFRIEFRRHFHQRWFEMYLAVALLRAGLTIECPPEGAPDVRVQHRDGVLWLEAIAPTGGDESNPDRVVQPRAVPGESSVAYYVPRDQIAIRICGALREKAARLMAYRRRGVIGPEHQAVVAINVRGIPDAAYEAEHLGPAAIYGLGPQFVTFDRATLDVVDSGFQHRPELLRRSSGSSVDAEPFLRPGLEHVAGALISGADAANHPHPPGHDFMLFPNPTAAPAYTERHGVWLAEVSLFELEPVTLLVSMAEELVRQYELPGDQGYRRWLVPAELINRHASVVEFRRRERGGTA